MSDSIDEKEQDVYRRLRALADYLRGVADSAERVDFAASYLSATATVAPVVDALVSGIADQRLGDLLAQAGILDLLKASRAQRYAPPPPPESWWWRWLHMRGENPQ